MARYMSVGWLHESPNEPIQIFSEIVTSAETRKVEVYRDGRMDYADAYGSTGTTRLSTVSMPSVADIGLQAEFLPVIITAADFEEVWRKAIAERPTRR